MTDMTWDRSGANADAAREGSQYASIAMCAKELNEAVASRRDESQFSGNALLLESALARRLGGADG